MTKPYAITREAEEWARQAAKTADTPDAVQLLRDFVKAKYEHHIAEVGGFDDLAARKATLDAAAAALRASHASDLLERIDAQAAEIERLRASMLRTADGVPIEPDMPIWSHAPRFKANKSGTLVRAGSVVVDRPLPARVMSLHGVMVGGYSTRAAAEASALIKAQAAEIENLTKLNEDKFRTIQAYCKAASEDKAEIERLTAIVDRLPKTADGVPVTPNTTLYGHGRLDIVEMVVGPLPWARLVKGQPAFGRIEDSYSTRAAAEAALKETPHA